MKQICLSCLVLLFVACSSHGSRESSSRSAYYWSTTWETTAQTDSILRSLQTLYLRYFDVVVNEEGEVMPNATLRFNASLPKQLNVVPVVFIVNDVMRRTDNVEYLAEKILRRVQQISDTHEVKTVKEVQIDCDWTMQTRKRYFDFLRSLQTLAHQRHLTLSTTVRLHQLSQPVPPVDRGVLMLYNTGDFTDIRCEQPILSLADVSPYLRYLPRYALPLSAAYPLFAYRIAFRGGKYLGVVHADNDLPLLPGDSILTRKATTAEVRRVQQAIEETRSDINNEIVIYDISPNHLSNYRIKDYEKIYHLR
ncbi:MAG: hypothetical protein LKG25_01515 [Prevotella sp.]|jgi:ribose 1,5-bisphosphokinase PhnN|nr:hypothetical protein [Prevotella sp.]MCI1281256.1 hypothetical protein [Prevotella sp.]